MQTSRGHTARIKVSPKTYKLLDYGDNVRLEKGGIVSYWVVWLKLKNWVYIAQKEWWDSR